MDTKMKFRHFCWFGKKTDSVKIQFTSSDVPSMGLANPTGSTIALGCADAAKDPNHVCISWKLIDPTKKPSRFNLDKANQVLSGLQGQQKTLIDLFSSTSDTDDH